MLSSYSARATSAEVAKRSADPLSAALFRAAALAIGRYFEQSNALNRPIRSLTIEELEAIAVAAVAAYQDTRIAMAPDARETQDLFEV